MRHTPISAAPTLPFADKSTPGRAFTIIELLVVLAVLGILGCLLAPALARTAPNSNGIQCVNNLRHLGAAWIMYAEDNHGKLVYNHDGGNTGRASGAESWGGGWLDFTSSTDNTNTDLLVNHQRYPYSAFLGPYIGSPRPFKCPADKSKISIALQKMARVRSVSMNGSIGDGARYWSFNGSLLYSNTAAIYRPAPSQLFVFLDEKEESINDGWFAADPNTAWQLVDYPAAYHSGGAGFGFADGHSEIHRWHDPRTMPILGPGQLLPLNVILPGDVDVQWLQQHAAAKR